MAGRSSWIMPGNGILSGISLDAEGGPGESGANFDNESPWTQAVREAWARRLQSNAEQPASDRVSQWSPGQSNVVSDSSFARGFAAPTYGTFDGQVSSANGIGGLNALAPSTLANMVPTGLRTWPMPRPKYAPPLPGTQDPWFGDQFVNGIQGLINFLRSGSGFGTSGGGDDGECYRRWEQEQKRCYNRKREFWGGCTERAEKRRDLCIRSSPYEPPEWSKADEEKWFNPDR